MAHVLRPFIFLDVFINIHTHHEIFDAKVELVSFHVSEEARANVYSYGIHPWKIEGDKTDLLMRINRVARNRRCIAVGECGLDKNCETDFKLQEEIFLEHVILANEIDKPLIIHCVKAFNELTACLRKAKNKVPVLIHGFNNNLNIAQTLLKEGYLLSFGKALLSPESNAAEAIKHCGRNNFFLETDDADISIKYIYKKAAEILSVDQEILQQQLKSNYYRIFKEEIL